MGRIFLRPVAILLLVCFCLQLLVTPTVYASGGPTQPEVQGFTPVGVSEMVNVSTGDFTYNLPLCDVGGYPLNMSYTSGGSMDQEASWVGFGWSLNPGVMNRTVRGLPDDFNGDAIKREFFMRPQATYGAGVDLGFELFGLEDHLIGLDLSLGFGVNYNTYTGYGFELNAGPSISTSIAGSSQLNVGLGLSASSSGGVSLSPSASFSTQVAHTNKQNTSLGLNIGTSINSRAGLSDINVGASFSSSHKSKEGRKNTTLSEEKSNSASIGSTSGSYSFVNPTYTPYSQFPTINTSFLFKGTFGAALFGLHPEVSLSGYFSRQDLLFTSKTDRAYGYLYEHNANGESLLDMNRENDGTFSDIRPNLPLANHTYDIFDASGQGVSGSFRPYRNDVGILHDPNVSRLGGGSVNAGLEFGAGNAAHFGGDVHGTINTSKEGDWTSDNSFRKNIGFKKPNTSSLQERIYFKQTGELNVDEEYNIYENWGKNRPVSVALGNQIFGGVAKGNLLYSNKENVGFEKSQVQRTKRLPRNQVVDYISIGDFKTGAGYSKNVLSYSRNDNYKFQQSLEYSSEIKGDEDYRKNHHIGQMTVLRPDGARYIYGIPAYNTKKIEMTFSVSDNASKDCATGLVSYTDNDAKIKNNNGKERFFDKTETPAYAHSYLLSGVISQDYVDLTDDGMTPDDLGAYTKFNYSLVESDFGWRTPVEEYKASFNEGLKTENLGKRSDDKGNIIYGEKELWYIHSIETKTHIAEFHTSPRQDGYEVAGINGGLGNGQMHKLDEIRLYTREEKIKEVKQPGYTAIPIKVVHFEYDYSLCPGFKHNKTGGGKLTLKSVYFTYRNSNKGVLNKYEFNYGTNNRSINPPYNLKAYDRWGNYSPNLSASCNGDQPTKAEFPYTVQNKINQDVYAQAWHLTQIKLPSGGKIEVMYESDDYAYVQDKAAMRMFKVTGTVSEPIGSNLNSTLFNRDNEEGNNYLVFELEQPIRSSVQNAKSFIKSRYLRNMKQLSFRFFLNLGDGAQEYVPGYAELAVDDSDGYGVYTPTATQPGLYTHGFVKLKGVGVKHKDDGGSMSPIAKAGWQYLRLNLPRVAYGQPDPNDGGFTQIIEAMGSTFKQIEQYIQGFNRDLMKKNYSSTFTPAKSWIRLYEPDGVKLGGGSRVKKIVISDEWDEMGGSYRSTYGQEYDYTTEQNINGDTVIISSGVASYEPLAGGDENPWKQPIFTNQKAYLAPGIDSYQEAPFGESYFPSPGVVYSKVSVSSLKNDSVTRNATGRVVHEFYTAKDFPTKVRRTSPATVRSGNLGSISNLLKIRAKEFASVSQGYVVELNDMHGKQKAQHVYPEGSNEAISWMKYRYATDANGDLENTRDVIYKYHPDGLIQEHEIGFEYDISVDMRHSKDVMRSGGASFNTDGFLAAIFPFVIPTIFPGYKEQHTQFRSVSVTKIINKAGILKETEAYDLGSKVHTNNLLYDAITGEVLLTKTINQYDDEVYAFSYPAHWVYDEMGPAYTNVGYRAKDVNVSNLNEDYFANGDELMLVSSGTGIRAWVEKDGSSISLRTIDGNLISGTYDELILIRSGRRNMQAISVGSVTTLSNPVKSVNGKKRLVFDNVISAEAVEYTDDWSVFCNCGVDPDGNAYNPFTEGAKGIWRPDRAFVYLTDRTQTNVNGNTNIRTDGVYQSFKPFWQPPIDENGFWYPDEDNWQFTSRITEFSTYGFELENRDALGRYSASVYGYSNTLPMGVANNAEYREIAFDNFEDYRTTDNCDQDHFSFRNYKDNLVEEEAHSGHHAIKVSGGDTLTVNKLIEVCDD